MFRVFGNKTPLPMSSLLRCQKRIVLLERVSVGNARQGVNPQSRMILRPQLSGCDLAQWTRIEAFQRMNGRRRPLFAADGTRKFLDADGTQEEPALSPLCTELIMLCTRSHDPSTRVRFLGAVTLHLNCVHSLRHL